MLSRSVVPQPDGRKMNSRALAFLMLLLQRMACVRLSRPAEVER